MAEIVEPEPNSLTPGTDHVSVRFAPPHRTLILANTRAGTLSSIERLHDLPHRIARFLRLSPQRHPDDLPISLAVLAQAAADAGLQADVEPIPAPLELPERLRAAANSGYDTVVAVGGDGTVRSVANGLLKSRAPLRLGILPLGSANNFAHALGLPFAMKAALQVIALGFEQRVDVGRIGGEYFLESAGVGLFADAVQAFGPVEPHLHEVVRILRVLIPLLWSLRSRNLVLTLDGSEERDESLIVAVSNAAYLAEGVPFAPNASPLDGLFDVVIVGKLTRQQLGAFAFAMMRGRHLQWAQVRHVRARVVEIHRVHRSHHPLPIHADDHIAGYSPARLEVVPGALRILLPPPDANSPPERVS